VIIDENMDPGHRHFSGMHWLYPNIFHSGHNTDALMNAAITTMSKKRQHSGGHTSWSSGWEGCLWARLRDGEGALVSLVRTIRKFSAPNMLSLHPPLMRSGPEQCKTCFMESPESSGRRSGADAMATFGRGLATMDESKASPCIHYF
jgi:hypothetical protein